eukprot:Opistho-2@78641
MDNSDDDSGDALERMACLTCRSRHRKCDGKRPCASCVKIGGAAPSTCAYPSHRKRGRKPSVNVPMPPGSKVQGGTVPRGRGRAYIPFGNRGRTRGAALSGAALAVAQSASASSVGSSGTGRGQSPLPQLLDMSRQDLAAAALHPVEWGAVGRGIEASSQNEEAEHHAHLSSLRVTPIQAVMHPVPVSAAFVSGYARPTSGDLSFVSPFLDEQYLLGPISGLRPNLPGGGGFRHSGYGESESLRRTMTSRKMATRDAIRTLLPHWDTQDADEDGSGSGAE